MLGQVCQWLDSGVLTHEEGQEVHQRSVVNVALELGNDDGVFLVVGKRLVGEVYVDDILERSVDVAQVLDILVVLQYCLLTSEAGPLDHHIFRVQCIRRLVDVGTVAVTEDNDLVVLSQLEEER